MDLMFGTYADRRKLALEGKVNLSHLKVLMLVSLVISYLSFALFNLINGSGWSESVIDFGSKYIPTVSEAMVLAKNNDRCAFVMTIQWFFLLVYIWFLVVGYFPLSRTMLIASKNWYAKNPVTSGVKVSAFVFIVFGITSILGDFGFIHFPTLLNGGYIQLGSGLSALAHMINSDLFMPFFSWIFVVGYAFIYWGFILALINSRFIYRGFNFGMQY